LDECFPPNIADGVYAAAGDAMSLGETRRLTLTTIIDDGYPEMLRELHGPPAALWSSGDWSVLRAPVVSIVGTRRATSYGLRMTREIAGALARAGACVVSGMALGIDAAAHRAALDANAPTVAVLGTGADVPYPRAHTALHREIIQRGLVISESIPGSHARLGSFPQRNRIIAALAQLVIVVEAPERSGALNTATHATELGRDVAVVPGPIDSPQSVGSNNLMRVGAHTLTSVRDALILAGLDAPVKLEPELRGQDEPKIWRSLEPGPATLDDLCARTALPVARCLSAVSALEIRGVVECAVTGEIRRR
jgi:DNA processing protein